MLNLWATINRIIPHDRERLGYSRGPSEKMRLGPLNNEVGLEVLISQVHLLGEADYVDV